jgi:hypothetical protein
VVKWAGCLVFGFFKIVVYLYNYFIGFPHCSHKFEISENVHELGDIVLHLKDRRIGLPKYIR